MPPVPAGTSIGISCAAAPVKRSVAGAAPLAEDPDGARLRPVGSVEASVEVAPDGAAGSRIWMTRSHASTDVARDESCIVSLPGEPRDGEPAGEQVVAARMRPGSSASGVRKTPASTAPAGGISEGCARPAAPGDEAGRAR